MGYYVEINGQIDRNTVEMTNEVYDAIKTQYDWITFDEHGFEYANSWSDGIIDFFKELSKIIRKSAIIVDYYGDESGDIKQFKISKNRIRQRKAQRIIYGKWRRLKLQ